MVVVYCLTRNLYKHIKSNINNVLKYNPDAKIYLIAEDDSIESIDYENVTIVNFNKVGHYLDSDSLNYNNDWTYMTLVRLVLPEIIKESRCIYLDVDTIIHHSLDELWSTDLKDKSLGACRYYARSQFNAGVLLMDLSLMRARKLSDKFLNVINGSSKLTAPDENVLNEVCAKDVTYISPKYNSYEKTVVYKDPVITHCSKVKQWIYSSKYHDTYLEFLNQGSDN